MKCLFIVIGGSHLGQRVCFVEIDDEFDGLKPVKMIYNTNKSSECFSCCFCCGKLDDCMDVVIDLIGIFGALEFRTTVRQ